MMSIAELRDTCLRGLLVATLIVATGPIYAAPVEVTAAAAATPAPLAMDVVLQEGGVLVGQLLSPNGAPVVGAEVRLTTDRGVAVVAKTNHDGGFGFQGARGLARLQAEEADLAVRVWRRGAAPPNAANAALLVQGDTVARGQHYAGHGAQRFANGSKKLFANPLFVAGVVATAVAIPVAIHNADDDDPASP